MNWWLVCGLLAIAPIVVVVIALAVAFIMVRRLSENGSKADFFAILELAVLFLWNGFKWIR